MKTPYVRHNDDFLPPFLREFTKKSIPFGEQFITHLCEDHFQEIYPFRENILLSLKMTPFKGILHGSDRQNNNFCS
jgi:hypothetical protein